MTKTQSWRLMRVLMTLIALAGICFLSPPANAQQPNYCYLENPFANPDEFGPFAVCRDPGCPRKHKGNDIMYCEGHSIPIQSGAGAGGGEAGFCNIIVNNGGNPIFLSQPKQTRGASYGLHMRFDCGNNIETRFAHIQGYNSQTQTIINGKTGSAWETPPHYHYEIYVDGHAVDPECVFGMVPAKSDDVHPTSVRCPRFGGPANLCDPNVKALLKDHARRKLIGTSPGTTLQPANSDNSRSPESFAKGRYGDPCQQIWNGERQCSKPAEQCETHDSPTQHDHGPGEGDMEASHAPDLIEGTYLVPDQGGSDEDVGPPGSDYEQVNPDDETDIPPLSDGDGTVNSSCAVDTWVALTNQSALESRRQTMMDHRFIAKADSVLDYGCFAKHMKVVENEIAGIFSETDNWVNREVDIKGGTHTMNKTLGSYSMDSALVNVVSAAATAYQQNFNHPLMGGLEGYAETPNSTLCQDMRKVWLASKCQNFPAPSEVFLQFPDLINKDTRQFPAEMICNRSGITQLMIDAAKGKATQFDKVEPKLERLLPPEDECDAPIMTGITVYRNIPPAEGAETFSGETKTYPDGICSNAGCSYDNPDLEGMGKCQKS